MKCMHSADPVGGDSRAGVVGGWLGGGLVAAIVLCACADPPKPHERVTGDCRALMTRCSSRQSTVDPGATEVRPDATTHAALVRIEFEDTVVDSKGNSQTTTPTDPGSYGEFFTAFASAARHPTERSL
jgi:hypothetical protein